MKKIFRKTMHFKKVLWGKPIHADGGRKGKVPFCLPNMLPMLLLYLGTLVFAQEAYPCPALELPADHSHLSGQIFLDGDRSHLEAYIQFDYVHQNRPTRELIFYLDGNLAIDSIQGTEPMEVNIEKATLNPLWQKITLRTKTHVERNQSVLLLFTYSGSLYEDSTVFSYPKIAPDWIELPGNIAWLPLYESFKNQFTFNLKVSGTEHGPLISNGSTLKTVKGYNLTTSQPVMTMSLWGSKSLMPYHSNSIELYSYDPNDRYVPLTKRCAEGIRFLHRILGQPDRLQVAKVLVPNREISGYSLNNMVALHRLDHSKPEKLVAFLVHEFSHAWWREADYFSKEHWLNESFAEYTGLLFSREKFGNPFFENAIKVKKGISKGLPPLDKIKASDPEFHDVIYHKGCIILYELEKMIGAQAFLTMLRDRVDMEIHTTEGLVAYIWEKFPESTATRFEKLLEH